MNDKKLSLKQQVKLTEMLEQCEQRILNDDSGKLAKSDIDEYRIIKEKLGTIDPVALKVIKDLNSKVFFQDNNKSRVDEFEKLARKMPEPWITLSFDILANGYPRWWGAREGIVE